MSNFTDIQVSGLATVNQVYGQVIAAGFMPVAAESNPAPLTASAVTHNLALPGFGGARGPMIWTITTAGASSELGGLDSTLAEPGMCIRLFNGNALGGNTWQTAEGDASSAAGNRFSDVVLLDPGTWAEFMYMLIGGVGFWCPNFAQPQGGT